MGPHDAARARGHVRKALLISLAGLAAYIAQHQSTGATMQLIPDAKHIWHRLWSMRFSLATAAVCVADELMAYLMPDHPTLHLALIAAGLSFAAAISRVVLQTQLVKPQ